MALSRDEANTVSSNYFDKTLTQQVYEKSPLFMRLKQRNNVRATGGNNIQFAIRHTTLGQAENVGARQQITYEQQETRTSGVLAWKYIVGKNMISWDERVSNSGKAQIVDLIRDKTEEMQQDMLNKFNTNLYATTQSDKAFSSLDTIIDTGTTYADIAVADAAEWAAAAEDTAEDRLHLWGSSTSVSKRINDATFGQNYPDLLVTTRDLFSKFESLADPQRVYRDNNMADIGFEAIKFGRSSVVADYACTASRMYGIDTSMLELRFHPNFNFKTDSWTDLTGAGFPQSLVKLTYWAGNLCCKMRKTNFKYTALDYTK
jgi:hypothetical protein